MSERVRRVICDSDVEPESYRRAAQLLVEVVPDDAEWRIYDHCASILRLYAIYESFFNVLVTDWLAQLPQLVPKYEDLSDAVRNRHADGVARVLMLRERDRYHHLTTSQILRGLRDGVAGVQPYELLPEAFLYHGQNLNQQVLGDILRQADIPDAWPWLAHHRLIIKYFEDLHGDNATADGELRLFLSYRNEAAHQYQIDDVLSPERLLKLVDFVEALCHAMAELVSARILEFLQLSGGAAVAGRITETFRDRIVVAVLESTELQVDDEVYIRGERRCHSARIVSLQLNDEDVPSVAVTDPTEVGIRFDVDTRENLAILKRLSGGD